MDYLAVTQPTAAWLLSKSSFLTQLVTELGSIASDEALCRGVATIGPLRLTASQDKRVLALWHVDYLNATGDEPWGLVQLKGRYGLLGEPSIARVVFERQLHIVDRRLQGLLLDASWELRTNLPPVTTCIAGRGAAWEEHRVAYIEGDANGRKGLLCIGPAWEDNAFPVAAKSQRQWLEQAMSVSNRLLVETARRPVIEQAHLRGAIQLIGPLTDNDSESSTPISLTYTPPPEAIYDTLGYTYNDWTGDASPLSKSQRAILNSRTLERQPLRILGAAGSGKTLLMMLLAIHELNEASQAARPCRILYIAHNSAMRESAYLRFIELEAHDYLDSQGSLTLHVLTLFDYSRQVLDVPAISLIDKDAQASKDYQLDLVRNIVHQVSSRHRIIFEESPTFRQFLEDPDFETPFCQLIADEISVAIKGNGITPASDKRLYTASEKRLSRLHGLLSERERNIMWEIYLSYHEELADEQQLLDADDLALSLLGRLRTPLWDLRRRKDGYDYVFIDETHLFNENERRLFPLLTKRFSPYVPIVIALDEAQQTRSLASAGIGLHGLEDVSNQTLSTVHRSSAEILDLAFFCIQQTTDLFGPNFPDFTGTTTAPRDSFLAKPQCYICTNVNLTSALESQISEWRKANVRRIGVICFADRYWKDCSTAVSRFGALSVVLTERGIRLGDPRQPVVALVRPDLVGGQEFEGVICVGLEQGVVPLRTIGNDALSVALEQQSLREMYLGFTRARDKLVIVLTEGSAPNATLQRAESGGLLERRSHD